MHSRMPQHGNAEQNLQAGHSANRPSESERKTQVNQSVSAGDHRGDRRDMSPTYTNNQKHASRGNTPQKDVSTRKR